MLYCKLGFNYIKIFLESFGCEDKEDLFEDFVSSVTSFCARIYGRRRTKCKTKQIIKTLQKEDDSNDSS